MQDVLRYTPGPAAARGHIRLHSLRCVLWRAGPPCASQDGARWSRTLHGAVLCRLFQHKIRYLLWAISALGRFGKYRDLVVQLGAGAWPRLCSAVGERARQHASDASPARVPMRHQASRRSACGAAAASCASVSSSASRRPPAARPQRQRRPLLVPCSSAASVFACISHALPSCSAEHASDSERRTRHP
jgi:hypothetical protein